MRYILVFCLVILPNFLNAEEIFDSHLHSEELFISIIDSTISSDSAFVDSTSVVDTANAVEVDTLIPLQYFGFSVQSRFSETITKEEINKSDYRYTGNVLSTLPFSYNNNLGWYGQPNELFLYGLGYGNITYLEDGIPVNNRLLNSLDLNFIQSEYLDSLEIAPLPQGFFYGSFNNPVAVNFITRDHLSARPYTRLRIIQAPEEEGFIDAVFNAYLMSRLNFSFEFSNAAVDPLYDNSNSSKWQLAARLRYMPGNLLNIIGSYSHVKAETHLFGGVDLSGFDAGTSQDIIDEYLYDPLNADVVYPDRYQKSSRHNFAIKVLGNFIPNAPSDLTVFHQTYLTEYRLNEKGNINGQPVITNNNEYNTTGFTARQLLNLGMINFDFNAAYENLTFKSGLLNSDKNKQMFSIGGKANFNLIAEIILPSVFIKSMRYSGNNYFGFGGDISFDFTDNISVYAGYSSYKKPLAIIEEENLDASLSIDGQNIKIAQAVIQYSTDNFNCSLALFNYQNDNRLIPVIDIYTDTLLINEIGYYTAASSNNTGINLSLSFSFRKLLLTSNASYYDLKTSDRNYATPEFTVNGGLYYIDTLFNDNLKLKAGINYSFYGIHDPATYDFQMSRSSNYYIENGSAVPVLINSSRIGPAFQLDLFAAGRIQDAAIVYLVFENVLNRKYYLAPGYPMFGPAFRFGLAWEFLD